MSQRRCPNCGGLVAVGVEFCQQCFEPIPREETLLPAPSPPSLLTPQTSAAAPAARKPGAGPSSGPFRRLDDGSLVWTCPACAHDNPIEAMGCLLCGTPFKQVFGETEPPPQIDPARATRLSLLFPGLGHHALGRTAEGLSRGALFLWSFGTALAILLIRRGQGVGPFGLLLAVLGISAAALYAISAVDAGRTAQRLDPILSTRTLLYGGSGMMLLTVLMMVVIVMAAGR